MNSYASPCQRSLKYLGVNLKYSTLNQGLLFGFCWYFPWGIKLYSRKDAFRDKGNGFGGSMFKES